MIVLPGIILLGPRFLGDFQLRRANHMGAVDQAWRLTKTSYQKANKKTQANYVRCQWNQLMDSVSSVSFQKLLCMDCHHHWSRYRSRHNHHYRRWMFNQAITEPYGYGSRRSTTPHPEVGSQPDVHGSNLLQVQESASHPPMEVWPTISSKAFRPNNNSAHV